VFLAQKIWNLLGNTNEHCGAHKLNKLNDPSVNQKYCIDEEN
jgi:hypothetical protein